MKDTKTAKSMNDAHSEAKLLLVSFASFVFFA
jgi:hypothetical protein